MRLSRDIIDYTNQMVSDCGLDSSSIFFYDETPGSAVLSYFYHIGVSDDAKYNYSNARIFESDPFTRALLCSGVKHSSRFVRWEDRGVSAMAAKADNYRDFLARHGVEVVGASTRQLAPGLCLIIGTHCLEGTRHKQNVPVGLLEQRIGVLSEMVTAQLLEDLLEQDDGYVALRYALPESDGETFTPPSACLSKREGEIARLICKGKQNKEIAYLTGLSEYTVENYLRRVYRKLDIRNRAALVAKMSRQLH